MDDVKTIFSALTVSIGMAAVSAGIYNSMVGDDKDCATSKTEGSCICRMGNALRPVLRGEICGKERSGECVPTECAHQEPKVIAVPSTPAPAELKLDAPIVSTTTSKKLKAK